MTLDFPSKRRLEHYSIFKHTHVMSGPLGCSAGWGFGSIRPRSCKPLIVSANPNNTKFISNRWVVCWNYFEYKTNHPYSYVHYEADFIHYLLDSYIPAIYWLSSECQDPFQVWFSLNTNPQKSDNFSMWTLHAHLTLNVHLHRASRATTECTLYVWCRNMCI